MSNGRKSIRARNAQAIRGDDPPQPEPDPAPDQEQGEGHAETRMPGTIRRTDRRVIQGIYFRAGVFPLAKAAYVRDFYDLPGSPDTIADWVARCIERHCDRTPEQRRAILVGIEKGGPRGDTRTFKIPTDTQERMRQTVATDGQQIGLVSSISEFAGAALTAAIDAARKRAGGELTPITKRLPNRLVLPKS